MSATEIIANYARSTWASGQNVPSPCVNVCQMDASGGLCVGCLRTLDEIATWSGMGNEEKRVVWERIVRRAELEPGA